MKKGEIQRSFSRSAFPTLAAACLLAGLSSAPTAAQLEETVAPRARDLGVRPGVYTPGPLNAITDVKGVSVGHATVIEADDARTGVTAILPHPGNLFQNKVAAAVSIFNAFGKLVGSTQIEELGVIETPIILTNTLSVWDAAAAMADWMLSREGNENVRSINPVVGETNDGFLNDIRGRHVKASHVRQALETASSGAVAEGSVGAGTGTMAFGWKGGIGTSSRQIPITGNDQEGHFTVGVLVQSNFGGYLAIDGVPVWRQLQPEKRAALETPQLHAGGSCMIVLATDAPLDSRQLGRLAARSFHGMARTGSSGSHGSGDYAIAFSTTRRYGGGTDDSSVAQFPEDRLSPLFQAAAEATEEAIYNSLLQASTVTGRDGHRAEAIPIERLKEILKREP